MNMKYRIVGGSIDLDSKQALYMEVFPVRNHLWNISHCLSDRIA